MNYWLMKSEPFKYSWDQFEKDGKTIWDGVRNYQARNNLREMAKGDLCFFYHSNEGKEIVGIAKVVKEHYQDPTSTDPNWVVVEIAPFKKLKKTETNPKNQCGLVIFSSFYWQIPTFTLLLCKLYVFLSF